MWYESQFVKAILTLTAVLLFAVIAFKLICWLVSLVYLVIRRILSPIFCGAFKWHDYEETSRKSDYDFDHVKSECRFCGDKIAYQANS